MHSLVEGLFPRKEGFIHLVECFFKIKPHVNYKELEKRGVRASADMCRGALMSNLYSFLGNVNHFVRQIVFPAKSLIYR